MTDVTDDVPPLHDSAAHVPAVLALDGNLLCALEVRCKGYTSVLAESHFPLFDSVCSWSLCR